MQEEEAGSLELRTEKALRVEKESGAIKEGANLPTGVKKLLRLQKLPLSSSAHLQPSWLYLQSMLYSDFKPRPLENHVPSSILTQST